MTSPRRGPAIALALLLASLAIAPARALDLRVELGRVPTLTITGPGQLTPADGGRGHAFDSLTLRVVNGRVQTDGGAHAGGLRLRPTNATLTLGGGLTGEYPGALRIDVVGTALCVVNEVDLEAYVRGVVPWEIGPSGRPAALEAQAIAARGFAVYRQRRTLAATPAATVDFTVAATQAYRGWARANAATDRAVAATAGQVVVLDGELVESLYSACCGGVQAAAVEAWSTPRPGLGGDRYDRDEPLVPRLDEALLGRWLAGGGDAWCRADPVYRWHRDLPLDAALRNAERWLERAGLVAPGRLTGVRLARRWPSGRVASLELSGARGSLQVGGDQVRWLFDAAGLPSTLATLTTAGGRLRVQGGGHGHGVGLCQTGTLARAAAGQSAARIIAAYYDGAAPAPIPPAPAAQR